MSYNTELQANNEELQSILDKVNALPNADSGGNVDYVVQDTPPEDTSVLWVDTSDNSVDELQEAVNIVLAQAKESGEFDGDDYVLTDADKNEIAELAAGLVKVPDSGGNVETDPTVPEWAKQPEKPTYTAAEVGALPDTTEVPTDAHINTLIDAKLAQFSNAEGVSF